MKNISGKIIAIILALFGIAITVIWIISMIETFTTEEIETVEFTTVLNHIDKETYTEGSRMGGYNTITTYTVTFKDDENNYVEEEISKKQYAKYHEGDKVTMERTKTRTGIFKTEENEYKIIK